MAERTDSFGTGAAAAVSPSAGPNPWPANAAFEADGMRIAGESAVALAGRFGTPLLVFDLADLVARLRSAELAFPKTFYAVKAFTAHAMLRLAVGRGAGPARVERGRGRSVCACRCLARADRPPRTEQVGR